MTPTQIVRAINGCTDGAYSSNGYRATRARVRKGVLEVRNLALGLSGWATVQHGESFTCARTNRVIARVGHTVEFNS